MSATSVNQFRELVWDYYRSNGRDMPWRQPQEDGSYSLYNILVSEIMLQQTQVARVIPKYESFMQRFPSASRLANTPLGEVLVAWSGLGYNRRAKFLWQAAKILDTSEPRTLEELTSLPGVGKNTAGALLAYVYNEPSIFIETNIRTVFLHYFFADRFDVPDTELLPLIEQTVDHEHPREWYWALMDLGTHIKATVGNASRQSKHYTKQSPFHGSNRQIRGQVIKILAAGPQQLTAIEEEIADPRLAKVLLDLQREGMIHIGQDSVTLA